jgi:hypothetical protein
MIAASIQTVSGDLTAQIDEPKHTRDQGLDAHSSPAMPSLGTHATTTGIWIWLDPIARQEVPFAGASDTQLWPTQNAPASQQHPAIHHRRPNRDKLLSVLKGIRGSYLQQYPEALDVLNGEAGTNASGATFSDQQLRRIARAGRETISRWAIRAAELNHISLERKPTDDFAEAASRLADAEVNLDEVERILIALRQAGVLTASQRGMLQVKYLR